MEERVDSQKDLMAACPVENPEHCKDEWPQSSATAERRNPPLSFVDSIMKALTTEMGTDTNIGTPDEPDSPEVSEGLFSETSAWTREEGKQLDAEVEEQGDVVMMLADVGNIVNELVSTVEQVESHGNTQLLELHNTICGLQVELHTHISRHQSEFEELQEQLRCLLEKAKITQLRTEIDETRELLYQLKIDNTELCKEVTDLRQSLHQSQAESNALREELKKARSLSVNPVHMDEKIGLLQEVERLKRSLQEAEQAFYVEHQQLLNIRDLLSSPEEAAAPLSRPSLDPPQYPDPASQDPNPKQRYFRSPYEDGQLPRNSPQHGATQSSSRARFFPSPYAVDCSGSPTIKYGGHAEPK